MKALSFAILTLSFLACSSGGDRRVLASTPVDAALTFLEACRRSCSAECDREMARLREGMQMTQQSCGEPGSRPRSVKVFSSGDCASGSLVASVGPDTDCEKLPNQDGSWGVRLEDGECSTIYYTTQRDVCDRFKPGRRTEGTKLYRGTGCYRNGLVAIASSETDCQKLSAKYEANSIRLEDGQCFEIPKFTERESCLRFKAGRRGDDTKLFRNRKCDPTSLTAIMSSDTDCGTLSTKEFVWSLQKAGEACTDFRILSEREACQRFR